MPLPVRPLQCLQGAPRGSRGRRPASGGLDQPGSHRTRGSLAGPSPSDLSTERPSEAYRLYASPSFRLSAFVSVCPSAFLSVCRAVAAPLTLGGRWGGRAARPYNKSDARSSQPAWWPAAVMPGAGGAPRAQPRGKSPSRINLLARCSMSRKTAAAAPLRPPPRQPRPPARHPRPGLPPCQRPWGACFSEPPLIRMSVTCTEPTPSPCCSGGSHASRASPAGSGYLPTEALAQPPPLRARLGQARLG